LIWDLPITACRWRVVTRRCSCATPCLLHCCRHCCLRYKAATSTFNLPSIVSYTLSSIVTTMLHIFSVFGSFLMSLTVIAVVVAAVLLPVVRVEGKIKNQEDCRLI